MSISTTPSLLALSLALLSAVTSTVFAAPSNIEDGVVRIITQITGGDTNGTGSGVVVSPGIVLTNWHVIAGANEISIISEWSVREHGSRFLSGQVVWESEDLDLALVKADYLSAPSATLATGELSKGQQVWALGFPAVVDRGVESVVESTLTSGVVGKISNARWKDNGEMLSIIQHDATISPGNSGGPLFDSCGRVIGINTALFEEYQGYSLASKINEILPALRTNSMKHDKTTSSCNENWSSFTTTLFAVLAIGLLASLAYKLNLLPTWTAARAQLADHNGDKATPIDYAPQNQQRLVKHNQVPEIERVTRQIDNTNTALRLSHQHSASTYELIYQIDVNINIEGDLIVAGRSTDLCDWDIKDRSVSDRHIRISADGVGALYIEDLNTLQGTTLNGHSLTPFIKTKLASENHLQLGEAHLLLTVSSKTL